MTDLHRMSLEDLRKLKKDVERAIATFQDRARQAALAEVDALAREKGFTLPELLKISGRKARASGLPRYANPANPAQTWTGRGRRPGWIEEALAAGRSLEDLKISS